MGKCQTPIVMSILLPSLGLFMGSLIPRGFKPQSLITDYAFSDRQGAQIKTNLLAFAHDTFRGPITGLSLCPANGISDVDSPNSGSIRCGFT